MCSAPDSSRIDALPENPCPEPASDDPAPTAPDPRQDLRDSAAAVVDVLLRGGSRCIRVRGTFPQQFIVAGTADQIGRLLDEPEL